MEADICPLCSKHVSNIESSSRLTEKGILSLQAANEARQDPPIIFRINSRIHKDCRVQYCHKREIQKYIEKKKKEEPTQNKVLLRSSVPNFSFKTDCFFCCQSVSDGNNYDVFSVASLSSKDTLLSHCKDRNDDWGRSVESRILSVHDLVAAGARYHKKM